jgi:hypothetical protein
VINITNRNKVLVLLLYGYPKNALCEEIDERAMLVAAAEEPPGLTAGVLGFLLCHAGGYRDLIRSWTRPGLVEIKIEIQKVAVYISDFICDAPYFREGESLGKPMFWVFASN